MLKITNVTKFFGKQPILKAINLEVKKGSVAVLLGSSGVGKSTLLRILCGLEPIDSGSITLDDIPLAETKHKVGIVFQHYNLFSHLNVIENITLPLEKVLGYSPKTAQLLALELLHTYGLADKATLCIKRLSGGQKQRLALLRTLALKPEIICFDEPTSALDPILKTQVATTIHDLAQQGYTVIVTTHDTLLAEKIPGTLHLMKQGTIIESATTHAYKTHPENFNALNQFIKGHEPDFGIK